jgi:Holliday junction resolvase
MSKINSKSKGSRGEREWANFCKTHGWNVRRTAQYCGNTGDASDCVGLPHIHQEIKRVEKLNISKAMEQARTECGDNIPIVAHRKNRERWMVTLDAEDFLKLYNAWEEK